MSTRDQGEKVLPSSRRPMSGAAADGGVAERETGSRQDRAKAKTRDEAKDGDKGKQGGRSAAEIEADLDAMTERLAANVDELVERLHPKRVAGRGVERLRRVVVTSDGRPRPEIVGAVVGGLLGVAALTWWSRAHR